MTTLQIYESIKQIFPQLLEPQIIAEMNNAQDKFARRTHILRAVGDLQTLTTKVSWDLISGFVKLHEVELYSSTGIILRKEDESINHFIDGGKIIFYDTSSTQKITTIPTSISYIWVRYSHLPTALVTVATALTIDTQFTEAVLAGALETFYGRIPVAIGTDNAGNVVNAINLRVVGYWRSKFKEIEKDARRWINDLDSTEGDTIIYQDAGLVYLPHEAKDANVSPVSWT